MPIEEVKSKDGKKQFLVERFKTDPKTDVEVTLTGGLRWDGKTYQKGDVVKLPLEMLERKPWLSQFGFDQEKYAIKMAHERGRDPRNKQETP